MIRVRQNSERNVLYLQVPRSSDRFVKITELLWICPISVSSVVDVYLFCFLPSKIQLPSTQFQSTLLIQHSSDFGDEIITFYLKLKHSDKLNTSHSGELIWQHTSIWLLTYLGKKVTKLKTLGNQIPKLMKL